MKVIQTLLFVFLAVAALARETPYNDKADAKLDVAQALARAATNNTPLIIVFGANWCGDCQMLNLAMTKGSSAALMAHDFQVVHVSVGHFDKNVDIAESYGVPLKKGIPAVAIVSPQNKVLYVTKAGELADARKMGEDGIYKFLKRVTAEAKTKE